MSGSSSSGSYKFDNFQVQVALDSFFMTQQAGTPVVNGFGWNDVTFKLQWNYKICADDIFNPCENGDIQVYTQTNDSSLVNLLISYNMDFSTDTPSFQALSSVFSFDQGDVEIYVHCSNTICIIPVDDIANMVANDFIPDVTTAITNAINAMAPKIEAAITPMKQLPITFGENTYIMNFEGELVQSANITADIIPVLTIAANGALITKTPSGQVAPTFSPSVVPSSSVIENFDTDSCLSLAPFFFESLIFAGGVSVLPLTVNPNEVPAASPVHLNTSDGFFTSVAPGLSSYPDLGVQVSIHSLVAPTVTFNESGIGFSQLEITADFTMLSATPQLAFTVLFSIDFEIMTTANLINPSAFSLNNTLVTLVPNASITTSNVGAVDPSGFVQLIQMVQEFAVQSIDLKYNAEVLQVLLDMAVVAK
eukprot:gene7897-9271_t